MDNRVPFFSNSSDNTHCFQAALRMVLKYFYPEENYSWAELDSASAKVKDLWTWPTAALIWLKQKGLGVKIITPFDYSAFINDGGDFLIKKYGEEVGEAQIKNSHIDQEREFAKKLLRSVEIDKKIPTINEIISLLQQGWLVVCSINAQALNNNDGYVGHFVVVKGFTEGTLRVHDPGLPAFENRIVSFENFENAWAYPNEAAKDIYAFKK